MIDGRCGPGPGYPAARPSPRCCVTGAIARLALLGLV